MRERIEPILKGVCLILAVLVLGELAGVFSRINPLHGAVVPALPTLTAETNALPETKKSTVSAQSVAETNSAATNSLSKTKSETNVVAHLKTGTNGASAAISPKFVVNKTNQSATGNQTNLDLNSHSNLATKITRPAPMTGMAAAGFNPFSPATKNDNLPAAAQTQINKITDSEILGVVIHPLPMALLGIAGDDAFLRAPDGQTGLVKTGDSLGGIKLLRIGINRVLVEQDGAQKELTIFSGYGGDSLLSKPGDTNNETHIQ